MDEELKPAGLRNAGDQRALLIRSPLGLHWSMALRGLTSQLPPPPNLSIALSRYNRSSINFDLIKDYTSTAMESKSLSDSPSKHSEDTQKEPCTIGQSQSQSCDEMVSKLLPYSPCKTSDGTQTEPCTIDLSQPQSLSDSSSEISEDKQKKPCAIDHSQSHNSVEALPDFPSERPQDSLKKPCTINLSQSHYNYFPLKGSHIFSLQSFIRRIYRKLLPLLKAHGRLRYPETTSSEVYRLSPRLAMKINICDRLCEANTLRFIRENTTIPVPIVIDTWTTDEGSITLMEWIPNCRTIRDCWPTLTQDQRQNIGREIQSYVDQLRSLRRPPTSQQLIGPIDKSPFYHDCVLANTCEPFASEKDFNDLLVSRVEKFALMAESARKKLEWIQGNLRDDHRILFTHGDLNPTNILIDRKGNVAAIIDWAMSGWMPEYWEYAICAFLTDGLDGWSEYAKTITYPDDIQLEVQNAFVEMYGYGPWFV
ncbi:hypothetical protein M422DRAFT_238560 [Sphaerobolus stellatus SS14]|nr:hypothetical protein M422DRAFT_238560 [Sphaerobolus stellatus SS14]